MMIKHGFCHVMQHILTILDIQIDVDRIDNICYNEYGDHFVSERDG